MGWGGCPRYTELLADQEQDEESLVKRLEEQHARRLQTEREALQAGGGYL